MTFTVFQISWLRLWNNKHELLLIFVVPILFFSIFALIFTRGMGDDTKTVRISIVDDAKSDSTANIIEAIREEDHIQVVTGVGATQEQWPIERLSRLLISDFDAEVVVYLPPQFGQTVQGDSEPIRILNEGTNPLSRQMVEAALSRAVSVGSTQFAQASPPSNAVLAGPAASAVQFASATRPLSNPMASLNFKHQSIFAENKSNPKIAMYAAGIAVMFLLFSSSGAGGSLLEEKEAGTLGRLLASRLQLHELLIGKWLYICVLGFLQISTMFVWGQFVFGVELSSHLEGYLVMAGLTSAASASFALFLASVCRSRTQLNGVSMVVVLGMSAIGGSMVPKYVMSESMQSLGRFTFNGWALDGFKKIFWYDLPLASIQTEASVLAGITVLLAVAANVFATRNQYS